MSVGKLSLTANVDPELHARFVALLPEGVSINKHLGALVEQWCEQAERPATSTVVASFTRPPDNRPVSSFYERVEGIPLPPRIVTEAPEIGDPGCTHPHGDRYRDGRSVICGLCHRVLAA